MTEGLQVNKPLGSMETGAPRAPTVFVLGETIKTRPGRIIGFDLGQHTAWAVVDRSESVPMNIANHGLIELGGNYQPRERLAALWDIVSQLIDQHHPSVVAIEYGGGYRGLSGYWFPRYAGVFELLTIQRGIPLVEINPSELKKSATGSGRAQKFDMCQAVDAQFGTKLAEDAALHHDLADAILVATYADRIGEGFSCS